MLMNYSYDNVIVTKIFTRVLMSTVKLDSISSTRKRFDLGILARFNNNKMIMNSLRPLLKGLPLLLILAYTHNNNRMLHFEGTID